MGANVLIYIEQGGRRMGFDSGSEIIVNGVSFTALQFQQALSNAAGTLTISDITDVTADAAEINKLDGMTSSKAELNKLTGLTTTAAALNAAAALTKAANQLDSTAIDIAGIVSDFNGLLAKLKAAGLMTANP